MHATPVAGMNFYRIQQTDMDNRKSLSAVQAVKLSAMSSLFFVIGNPVVNGSLQVQVNEPAILSLYDAHGRLVYKKQATSGMETINVSRYPKGVYLLKAKEEKVKIIIQ